MILCTFLFGAITVQAQSVDKEVKPATTITAGDEVPADASLQTAPVRTVKTKTAVSNNKVVGKQAGDEAADASLNRTAPVRTSAPKAKATHNVAGEAADASLQKGDEPKK